MTTDTNSKLPSPDDELRSDLWPAMSVSQLYHQQELVLDKITKLRSIMPFGVAGTPAIAGMMVALQQAMMDLNLLIESKSTQKPRRTVDGQ